MPSCRHCVTGAVSSTVTEADQVWFFSKQDDEQIIVVAPGYADRFRYSKRFDYVRDGVAVAYDWLEEEGANLHI